jgi:uncharacterized protein DUF6894
LGGEETALDPANEIPGIVVMPRYFFNLNDGSAIRDPDGVDLAGPEEANATAAVAAQDLARNKLRPQTAGVYICVTDENGKEVFRTPLAL